MVNEYVLKVDIDSSELERKLKAVFSKLGGMVGSGAGGKGGVMGALGSSAGKASFVKIAGLVGIAGGMLGLGKMIIDSSPMLKAMFKLMHTGIMLMLKPIGDTIGFILRPLIIHFVRKIAIPFYRRWIQLLPKVAAGIDHFMNDPEESLKGTTKAVGKAVDSDMMAIANAAGTVIGNVLHDIGAMIGNAGKFLRFHFDNFMDFFSEIGEKISSGVTDAWNSTVEFFTKIGEGISSGLTDAWTSFIGFITGMGAAINSFVGSAWVAIVKWFSDIGKSIPSLEDIWKGITDAFDNLLRWLRGLPIIGGLFGQNEDNANSDSGDISSETSSSLQENGEEAVSITDQFLGFFEEMAIKFGLIKDKNVQSMKLKADSMEQDFDLMEKDTEDSGTAIENIANLWVLAMKKLQDALESVARLTDEEGKPTHSARMAMMAQQKFAQGAFTGKAASFKNRFTGGIIPEHVVGLGQSTGAVYQFGEKGPETVSPGAGNVGGTGGLSFNININGGNTSEIEREIRPIILRILKENTSRRGIL